jgi:putative ABC transport system ATP-binding protein
LTLRSPEAPAIHLDDLHLRLTGDAGEVNILRGVDLTIEPGEAVGLIGASGSGKTSLLMVIAGLEAPSSGDVRVAGADIAKMDEDALALFRRDHVSIVFQDFHLMATMTALENVALPLEFAGRADAFACARDHLEQVGLGHRIGHYPGQLSGGEKQRVALARAFAVEPSVLLADEPTGNLDTETGQTIIDLMFDLRKRLNTTMILVTHEPVLASRCARILRLVDGRIAEDSNHKSAP